MSISILMFILIYFVKSNEIEMVDKHNFGNNLHTQIFSEYLFFLFKTVQECNETCQGNIFSFNIYMVLHTTNIRC